MILTYLRRSYTIKVKLFPDDDTLYEWRWYKAHPKAKLFPGRTFELSRFWENYTPDWGEQGKHTWYNGKNVGNKKGQCFIGKQEWFHTPPTKAEFDAYIPKPCSSCPKDNLQVNDAPRAAEFINTWWTIAGLYNYLPFCVIMTISGSGTSDQTTEMAITWDPFIINGWSCTTEIDGTSRDLALNFSDTDDRFHLVIDLPEIPVSYSIGDDSPYPGNPFHWQYTTTGDPYSLFLPGTVITIDAVALAPSFRDNGQVMMTDDPTPRERAIVFVEDDPTSTEVGDGPYTPGFSDGFGTGHTSPGFSDGFDTGFGAGQEHEGFSDAFDGAFN